MHGRGDQGGEGGAHILPGHAPGRSAGLGGVFDLALDRSCLSFRDDESEVCRHGVRIERQQVIVVGRLEGVCRPAVLHACEIERLAIGPKIALVLAKAFDVEVHLVE